MLAADRRHKPYLNPYRCARYCEWDFEAQHDALMQPIVVLVNSVSYFVFSSLTPLAFQFSIWLVVMVLGGAEAWSRQGWVATKRCETSISSSPFLSKSHQFSPLDSVFCLLRKLEIYHRRKILWFHSNAQMEKGCFFFSLVTFD